MKLKFNLNISQWDIFISRCKSGIKILAISHPLSSAVEMIYVFDTGESCNKIYSSHTQIKPKSCEVSFVQNNHFSCEIVLEIWTRHGNDAAVLHVNFKMIWQQNKQFWTNQISRGLSLGCVSDRYPIFSSAQCLKRDLVIIHLSNFLHDKLGYIVLWRIYKWKINHNLECMNFQIVS